MSRTTDLFNRFRGLVRDGGRQRLAADVGGQLLYLGPTRAELASRPAVVGDERLDLVATWSATGALGWDEAEQLLALDDSTPWGRD